LPTPASISLKRASRAQRYNVAAGEIEHESVKYRVTGVHKSTEKGNIETGNPYGSTEKYSILRYEEEVNGKITTLVDAMAGIIKYNGKDCTNVVENLLELRKWKSADVCVF